MWEILYFSDYKTHFPKKIWEENGGVSYSPNVAYLACREGGWGSSGGARVFSPIFLLYNLGASYGPVCLIV